MNPILFVKVDNLIVRYELQIIQALESGFIINNCCNNSTKKLVGQADI